MKYWLLVKPWLIKNLTFRKVMAGIVVAPICVALFVLFSPFLLIIVVYKGIEWCFDEVFNETSNRSERPLPFRRNY